MDPCSIDIYVHGIHRRVREKGCGVSCQAGSKTGDMSREGARTSWDRRRRSRSRSSAVQLLVIYTQSLGKPS